MEITEKIVDAYLDAAIDIAVNVLDKKQILPPYSFLVLDDGSLQTVFPNESDYLFENQYLIDTFKDFGNEKLSLKQAVGFCIISDTKTSVNGAEMNTITIFLKFENDTLPLKTRVYYFPYIMTDQKPNILFDLAFSSEA